MNRRVLDNVVITALDKHGDEELVQQISDMFGAGTLVEDAKIPTVYFDKSMLGLQPTNISNMVRKLSKELMPTGNAFVIVDSDGDDHSVSKEAVSILKGLSFYRITCPVQISDCIGNLFKEIDNSFRGLKTKEIITTTIEDSESGEREMFSNKNLMNYCRTEVFGLLKEAGVSIG